MERVARSLGRTTENDEFQRMLRSARGSPELSANLDGQGTSLLLGRRGSPHPEVRARAVVSERRAEEGASRLERPRYEDLLCETCCLRLERYQQVSHCRGCGNWTHRGCVEQLDIGMSWHAEMCLTCKHKATRWLRVVSAVESSQWYRWNEEDWFWSISESTAGRIKIGQIPE